MNSVKKKLLRFCVFYLILFCTVSLLNAAHDYSWIVDVDKNTFEERKFKEWDSTTGATWRWSADKKSDKQLLVHEPFKGGEGGVVFADIPVNLPQKKTVSFDCSARVPSSRGDGIGLSFLVQDSQGKLTFVTNTTIPPKDIPQNFHADLSKWAGESVVLRIMVDSFKGSGGDSTWLRDLRLSADGQELAGNSYFSDNAKTGIITASSFNRVLLQKTRFKDTSIMNRHHEGFNPKYHLYSSKETWRPLLGAYVSLDGHKNFTFLRDVLDFAQINSNATGNRRMEETGMPWIQMFQQPIPLGQSDTRRWKRIDNILGNLSKTEDLYKFRLGLDSGSEPHISPDYRYTGMSKEEVERIPSTPETSAEFGQWLASLYKDEKPSIDTNNDGITFKSDFGYTAETWEKLGLATLGSFPDRDYLLTLYREYLMTAAITGIDKAYEKTGLVTTSRLLSYQFPPVFGQSLRQLRLPSRAVGVTYYTNGHPAFDPRGAQAIFSRTRHYKSEKSYSSILQIRPPFAMDRPGSCVGLFGPYVNYKNLEVKLKAGFSKGDPLLVTIEQVREIPRPKTNPLAGEVLKKQEWTVQADSDESVEMMLVPMTSPYILRITCRSTNKGNSNTSVYIDPTLHVGDKSHSLVSDYYESSLFTVYDSAPDTAVVGTHVNEKYDPSVTEFKGSYLWGIAKKRGIRPVYNEFRTGSHNTATPGHIYRGVFHELQYKPALISYFLNTGGNPNKNFSRMDIYPYSTELAVLRSQLELMRPYASIERKKRPLAVFLPVAAPCPVGAQIVQQASVLAPQLEKIGPDVFLTDDLDEYMNYDNILIVLGFLDGKTDIFLSNFLKKIPPQKKIMIICTSGQLYCEPGVRASKDFRSSLKDVLPVYPSDLERDTIETTVQAPSGKSFLIEVRVARKTLANPEIKYGKQIKKGSHIIGWSDRNLLMLAGNPTKGLSALIEDFFGLQTPALREAGSLKILNRSTTANEPGQYCLDEGQSLTFAKNLIGYDLAYRRPLVSSAQEESVVDVFTTDSFKVLDAGTTQAHIIEKGENHVLADVELPRFPFEGNGKPEFIIYSNTIPEVSCNGVPIQVNPDKVAGFYQCDVEKAGRYLIRRREG
ncbi:hypothetical protein OpiT1DRAFT_05478 [Opitutaceae bacterium TAV1]|nr:hypothetical protein OpiT1DRAFT_05478 [Opitutaceae bacterium TAV1]